MQNLLTNLPIEISIVTPFHKLIIQLKNKITATNQLRDYINILQWTSCPDWSEHSGICSVGAAGQPSSNFGLVSWAKYSNTMDQIWAPVHSCIQLSSILTWQGSSAVQLYTQSLSRPGLLLLSLFFVWCLKSTGWNWRIMWKSCVSQGDSAGRVALTFKTL